MTEAPVAIFRFYASHWRGAGHAMRCMTLAKALQKQGWVCRFVSEAESYEFVPALANFERVAPEEFHANPCTHDLLVVDHYDCGYEYEHHFRPYNRVIMAIDDIANRKHDCDIILDQAYGRAVSDYESDVPAGCEILVGPEFGLLREEFAESRPASLARRQDIDSIQRVFLNFGGNDQKNFILETLRQLSVVGYAGAIDVVFGVMAPHRASVEEFAATMPNDITFHTNPDMAALLVQADLAVGAPAVSAWERFCLGVPTILLQTADNQSFTYQALVRDGLALGGKLESLGQKGLLVDFDKDFYQSCVDQCAAQTDGQGPNKIVNIIQDRLERANGLRKKIS